MAIRDPRNLQCWQLADGIRRDVIAICAKKQVASDFRFCDGFRDAAGSVCRNIAEGFRRYESAEIVQFFRYALASLGEVQDYLAECVPRGALADSEHEQLFDRCEHTRATSLNFIKPHVLKIEAARASRRRSSTKRRSRTTRST